MDIVEDLHFGQVLVDGEQSVGCHVSHGTLGYVGDGSAHGGVVPGIAPEATLPAEGSDEVAHGLQLLGYPDLPFAQEGEGLEVLGLDNYDSNNYEVDVEGDWEETETINDFREEASDDLLHSPATVDDNHLIFYNEDEDHVEVMNMVPKHHLDSLHKNPDKQTKFIKRAED